MEKQVELIRDQEELLRSALVKFLYYGTPEEVNAFIDDYLDPTPLYMELVKQLDLHF